MRQNRHRTQTGQKDAEENSEDDFDLLDFLTTTQASARDAGIKRKHVGVTFDDLSVIGNGGLRLHIRTFPDAIWQTSLWAPMYIARLLGAFTPKPKKLLHSFTGSVKPGEMVLVLGRPGSGCSTCKCTETTCSRLVTSH